MNFRRSLPTVGLITGVLVFLGAWGSTFWFAMRLNKADHHFGSGTFGDAFGAANAGFTGLALIALSVSIWVQRKELKTAQEDRDATRQSLDIQIELNGKLAADLERRRIEDAFYRLISQAIELRPEFPPNNKEIAEAQEKLLVHLQNQNLKKGPIFAPLSLRRNTTFYAALKASYRLAVRSPRAEDQNHMLQILAESLDADGLSVVYAKSLLQLAYNQNDEGFRMLASIREHGFLFDGINERHDAIIGEFLDPELAARLKLGTQ